MTRVEIVRAVTGAALLARFDARGMTYFDVSADGFWNSFFAAVLTVPFTLYWMVIDYPETEAALAWVITVEMVRYCVGWALFPLVMIPITRALGLSGSYVQFIIAYNWSMVVQAVLYFVVTVISQTALVPPDLYFLVSLATLVYTLAYFVFIARTALGVSILGGTLLSLLDFFLSYALILQSDRLL
ncbi:MAG: hypothetical protein EXQ93_06480 [Alphaproteobacteria bacterium]|nr:hypothetical protein [Alphaproteobacteria bacterium]